MLQKDKVDNKLENIKNWRKMVIKVNEIFFAIDYQ